MISLLPKKDSAFMPGPSAGPYALSDDTGVTMHVFKVRTCLFFVEFYRAQTVRKQKKNSKSV
jgi:hypothetical protein